MASSRLSRLSMGPDSIRMDHQDRRDDADEQSPAGLWPSDHGGVVSTLRLSK